jgi:hypothetical protein
MRGAFYFDAFLSPILEEYFCAIFRCIEIAATARGTVLSSSKILSGSAGRKKGCRCGGERGEKLQRHGGALMNTEQLAGCFSREAPFISAREFTILETAATKI